mmetsp:Transcript_32815/g.29106  ORF Transcript_32815/g.29106 Transcript_32815/m.29106 type:complete len:196 (+) Transcript_32815:207-794(+)
MREMLYLCQQQGMSPKPTQYCDSVLDTPQRSDFKDYNSSSRRPPILKRYRSNNTSMLKKEDSKVRFKNLGTEERDRIIPQRLDFDSSYAKPYSRKENVRRMGDLERSIDRDRYYYDYCDADEGYMEFDDSFDNRRDRQTQILDLRNIDEKKSNGSSRDKKKLPSFKKHSSYKGQKYRNYDDKNHETKGDYDLLAE